MVVLFFMLMFHRIVYVSRWKYRCYEILSTRLYYVCYTLYRNIRVFPTEMFLFEQFSKVIFTREGNPVIVQIIFRILLLHSRIVQVGNCFHCVNSLINEHCWALCKVYQVLTYCVILCVSHPRITDNPRATTE